ncbi:MAG: hypothetical protein PVF65_11560, partial [Sphingomonadales bacterium]
ADDHCLHIHYFPPYLRFYLKTGLAKNLAHFAFSCNHIHLWFINEYTNYFNNNNGGLNVRVKWSTL